MPLEPFVVAGAFVASFALTAAVRAYAVRRNLVDVPNERSSHLRVTPRGGGAAVAVAFLASLGVLGFCGLLPAPVAVALGGGGLLVALVGFVDDHRPLRPVWRALAHVAAAAWALVWLGGGPDLDLGFAAVRWGLFGHLVAALALVWLVNLYNFMDGVDGIAASEAVFAAAAAALLLFASGASDLAWTCAALAAAAAGFGGWNWPPARIFLGDVGSGFLGFSLGCLALGSAKSGALSVWPWLVLLGTFAVDATVTLLRRAARGERWTQAHRSHAYQHLAQRWHSHGRVTAANLAVGVGWLLPWAVAASRWPKVAPALAGCALIPLAALAVRLRAGLPGAPAASASLSGAAGRGHERAQPTDPR